MTDSTYVPDDRSVPTDPVALAAFIRSNRDEPGAIDLIREDLRVDHGPEGSWSIWDAANYLVDAGDELSDAITSMLDHASAAERALAKLTTRHPAYDCPAGDDILEHLGAVAQRLRAVDALHSTLTASSAT